MNFSLYQTLKTTELFVAFSILIQTIELLMLRKSFNDQGVWRWDDLVKDYKLFPKWIPSLLSLFLRYRPFVGLLVLRLLAAISLLLLSHPSIVWILLVCNVLVLLRWRGTFNGGSDYMTLVVLMAISVAHIYIDNAMVVTGALWYITINVCTSYFVPGYVKLKSKDWRSGKALGAFGGTSFYGVPTIANPLFKKQGVMFFLTWLVTFFQLIFPIALLGIYFSIPLAIGAATFHLGNLYLFGLNRFLYAWIATYPALIFCSQFFK